MENTVHNNSYEFEVAFSFLDQDLLIAHEINDLVVDRFSTFIYSEREKELVGPEGDVKFSNVFAKEARIVVVLYRDGWGKSVWTRIEENSIKNRGRDNGYSFLLLVMLDSDSKKPEWLEYTYIWDNYNKSGSKGVANVIEYKVNEKGGNVRPETYKDKSERLKRKREAEANRESYLKSHDSKNDANSEVIKIFQQIKENKSSLEDPKTSFYFAQSEQPGKMYGFGNKYWLYFTWKENQFDHLDSILSISIVEMASDDFGGRIVNDILKCDYKFDKRISGEIGWSEIEEGTFCTTETLIDYWLKQLIECFEKN
ncbi:MAG: hypothetical protein JXB49_31730 [Bacteroidales bacterium]|nr:hypothetical protein [Bacteroidales bacterium]